MLRGHSVRLQKEFCLYFWQLILENLSLYIYQLVDLTGYTRTTLSVFRFVLSLWIYVWMGMGQDWLGHSIFSVSEALQMGRTLTVLLLNVVTEVRLLWDTPGRVLSLPLPFPLTFPLPLFGARFPLQGSISPGWPQICNPTSGSWGLKWSVSLH